LPSRDPREYWEVSDTIRDDRGAPSTELSKPDRSGDADATRRFILRTAMLSAPVILTLKSKPALASAGSSGSQAV
jgi:hypothetical protein